MRQPFPTREVPAFDRRFFASGEVCSRIGKGDLGGKARGLVFARDLLEHAFDPKAFPAIEVGIPRMAVIGTGVFDQFMEAGGLREIAGSEAPDHRIAHAFQQAELPVEIVGDLRALMDEARSPLAVRSSSLLEDALARPFAGVYETKMTPNNQSDPDIRFRKMVEAVKFVFASTFFGAARGYMRAAGESIADEKMAVIIQEVVGARHGDRFYPNLSGVGRSYNFYPTGTARPDEGVVDLALGLGKTIVDGGIAWTYSPAHPKSPPPYGSVGDLMKHTQTTFWAVNMGRPPAYDPVQETEFLTQCDLAAAEYDGTLREIASTYVADSDRLVPGVGTPGPRVVNFSPLLVTERYPLNAVIDRLLRFCEKAMEIDVEIEFAAAFPQSGTRDALRFGLLQVRPMAVSDERVEIAEAELASGELLLASDKVMGNGVVDTVCDIVYVKPDAFEARHTRAIASELDRLNRDLLTDARPYLLIGFGRWGSADPWLGIPVDWGQIGGAKVIVEATLPEMHVDPSQGSHFFHNITSFRVSYFAVHHAREPGINWEWLAAQPARAETKFLRHIRLAAPLVVKVDGRSGRGAIWYGEP